VTPRRIALRLVVSSLIALLAWVLLQAPVTRALRDLAAGLAVGAGMRPVVEGPGRASRALRPDHLGVLVNVGTPDRPRMKRYVVELMRWHVNLIALPPLIISVGALSPLARAAMLLVGVPLLLFADAACIVAYLGLASERLRGGALVTPETHATIEFLLATVLVKLLPVAVWAVLFLGARRMASSRPMPPPSAAPGALRPPPGTTSRRRAVPTT
jgi:hypothetical protein